MDKLFAVKYAGDILTGTPDTWQIWTSSEVQEYGDDQRVVECHPLVNSGRANET